MVILSLFINYILHLDKYLASIIQYFGIWAYVLLFLIIFCETGLVVTPFLPGDSLLFAAATLAAAGALNIWWLFLALCLAAFLGDTANYWIGHYLGAKAFKKYPKIFKKQYLDKTRRFYDKYGNSTIVLARFVPIVRTFAPFLAGVGKMKYGRFIVYNILGSIIWIGLLLSAGYFFGNLPVVKNNFSMFILLIIIVSFIPLIIEFMKIRNEK